MQFTPDLLGKLVLTVHGQEIGGQYFLQSYKTVGGKEAGRFADGQLAAVEHDFGQGRTLLIGTFPGGSYFKHHAPGTRDFFAGLLGWAGLKQQVRSSDHDVKARLHEGAGGTFLWVINPTRTSRTVKISLPATFQTATELWQTSSTPKLDGMTVTTTIEDRNAAVIRLK